jgi:hypothetical protein
MNISVEFNCTSVAWAAITIIYLHNSETILILQIYNLLIKYYPRTVEHFLFMPKICSEEKN